MAVTRFYLSSTAPADVTPLAPVGWTETTGYDVLEMSTSLGVSAMTSKTRTTALTAANSTCCLRQYLSNPLQAQDLPVGTVKGTVRCLESAINDNIDEVISRFVVMSNDGQTLRGTLLAIGRNGGAVNEFATTLTARRIANGAATSALTIQQGDRLMLEIGFGTSVGGTSISGSLNFGDNSGSDLGDNETDTGAFNPFIEFSFPILLVGPSVKAYTHRPAPFKPGIAR